MNRRIVSIVLVSAILFVLMASLFAARVYASPTWTVTLVARLGPYTSTTILGVADDATNGFETTYDAIAPPAPPEGVFSYFWYPSNPTFEQKLSTSIIPPSSDMTWTLRVLPSAINSTQYGDTMVLNWTALPPQYSGYIKNSGGTTILADMSLFTEYSYSAENDILVTFRVNLVIPELPIGSVLALAVCFASYGAFRGLKRISYQIA